MRSVALISSYSDKVSANTLAISLQSFFSSVGEGGDLRFTASSISFPKFLSRAALGRRLRASDATIAIWSNASKLDDPWVLAQLQHFQSMDSLFNVMLERCSIPTLIAESQAFTIDATDFEKQTDYFLLAEAISEVLSLNSTAELAEFRRGHLGKELSTLERKRERRFWSFRDMYDLCKKLVPTVLDFEPDVFIAFDARGGIWAQLISELSGKGIPTITCFRLKSTGPRKASDLFNDCVVLEAGRWHLLIPPMINDIPRTKKIVIVDDYTDTGLTCSLTKTYFVDTLGWHSTNVKTIALLTSRNTKNSQSPTDWSAISSDAAVNDLFYMYKR